MASLILLCAVFFVLGIPFIPLVLEWRKPSDVAALTIPDSAFEDARALALRWLALLREAVRLRSLDPGERAAAASGVDEATQSALRIEPRIALSKGQFDARVLYA